jgi:hypothetical protein
LSTLKLGLSLLHFDGQVVLQFLVAEVLCAEVRFLAFFCARKEK